MTPVGHKTFNSFFDQVNDVPSDFAEHGIELALLASEAVEGALVAGGATTGAAAEDIAEPYLRTVASADAVALGDGT